MSTERYSEEEQIPEAGDNFLFSEKSDDGTETFFHKVDGSLYKKILPDGTIQYFEKGELINEGYPKNKSFEDTLSLQELEEEEEDRQVARTELERREAMNIRLKGQEEKKKRETPEKETNIVGLNVKNLGESAGEEKKQEQERKPESLMNENITFSEIDATSEKIEGEKPETEKSKEEITKDEFENLFGIKKEDLNSVEGFDELSEGQKRLVLQNMEGMALGRVKTEAIKQYKEETAQKSFMPRVARGILKNFYVAKAEKQIAGSVAGDKEANLELLKDFTRMTHESGIDAHFGEKGDLVMDYTTCDVENPTDEEKQAFNYFNEVAVRLAEGNTREAGKGLKLDVRNNLLEAEYKSAIHKIIEIKASRGTSQREEYEEYAAIDKRVRMAQFLNANPEVEKELEEISSKPFWHRALFNTATERGGYMAMGYAGRGIAALGGLSVIGVPIVAAGAGAFFARRRAIRTVNEEFEAAKVGEKSSLMTQMEKKGGFMQAKTSVEANALSRKIDSLLERIEHTGNETEKAQLRTLLDKRLYYTHYVLDNKLVGFSGESKKLTEQYDLISKLGQAEIAVQMGEKEVINDLGSRLDDVLALKAQRGEKGRKGYIRKQVAMGAALGATFAVIGAEVRDLFFGGRSSETAEHVLETQRGGKGVIGEIPEKGRPSFVPPMEKGQGTDSTVVAGTETKGAITDTTFKASAESASTRGAVDTSKIAERPVGDHVPFTPKTAPEVVSETDGVIAETPQGSTQGYEATIEKGSNIWNTAEKIAKEHGLSKEEFAKAWGNPESVFKTIDGKEIHISEMGLVQEEDKIVYVLGTGEKAGHFELVDMNNDSRTNAQYYELIQKRKGTPPEWLRKAVLGEKELETEEWDKLLENVEGVKSKTYDLGQEISALHTPHHPVEVGISTKNVSVPLTHEQFFHDLAAKDVPTLERTADNFHSLSLADQEAVMRGKQMDYLRDHMKEFGTRKNLTLEEVDLLGRVNKSYTNISSMYNETLQRFEEAVQEGTGLAEKPMEKLFGTRINEVFDAYKGNDKVLDFVKSVNPSSGELRNGVSIEEVLKNRFLEDHFGSR